MKDPEHHQTPPGVEAPSSANVTHPTSAGTDGVTLRPAVQTSPGEAATNPAVGAPDNRRGTVMSRTETALVRVEVTELDDTFLGTRLLICGPTFGGAHVCVCGGVSDVVWGGDRRTALLWLGGRCVYVAQGSAVIVAEGERLK